MDPQKPASFNHRTQLLSTGRTYHFVDQIPNQYKPQTTPTILCVHGFPDLWYVHNFSCHPIVFTSPSLFRYGWRYQIAPWVLRGFRVVVPDMLGYGGTDKPVEPSEYSMRRLCDDLAALLNNLGLDKAVGASFV